MSEQKVWTRREFVELMSKGTGMLMGAQLTHRNRLQIGALRSHELLYGPFLVDGHEPV